MREYLPLIIVLSIIGAFTVVFLAAYAALRKQKDTSKDRHIADGEIVRRLVKYAKPYWKQFIVVFLIMIVSVIYDVVSPLLIGHIQGIIKADFELSYLYSMVACYGGILVVSLAGTYAQSMILQRIGQKILASLRLDIFTHIESLSHAQLNDIPVGKLVTRVCNDTNAISMMFTNVLVTMVKNVMVIFGVLGGMLMLMMGQAQRQSTFIGNALYRINLPTRVRRQIDDDGTLSVHIAMSLRQEAGEEAMTQEEIAATIEREAVSVLLRLRAASCDAAGFGRIAIRESLDIPHWEARNWPDEYEQLGVRVSADVRIQ